MALVRRRLWLWGHDAGSHDTEWLLPGSSRITPVEAAFYMGIPNAIMVRYGKGSLGPTAQYTVPFRALEQVVWSIVGAGGTSSQAESDEVLAELPGRLENMAGVMMDDFFHAPAADGQVAALSTDRLEDIRRCLAAAPRPLDLWAVLYTHQMDLPVADHLKLCDKVSLWTWHARDLSQLEANLARLEQLAPACGKVLGCYMWDYGVRGPMPLDAMRRQCEAGLRWLREGRIEGMIFLASCICDLGLEAVEWTRRWIAEVGGQEL